MIKCNKSKLKNIKSFKIWAMACVQIFFCVIVLVFQEELEFFDFIFSATVVGFIVWGTFLITEKYRKSGVKLLISTLVVPRVITFLCYFYCFLEGELSLARLTISGLIAIAIILIESRLILQWTTPLWQQEGYNLSKLRFWKRYIYLEGFIVGVIVFFIGEILVKNIPSISSLVAFIGIPVLYKEVSRQCLGVLARRDPSLK